MLVFCTPTVCLSLSAESSTHCWQAECRVQLGVTWPFDFKSLHDIQLGKLPSLPHPVRPSRHHTCFTSCHLMSATSFSMTIWKHGWFVAHLYSTMGPPLDLVFSFVCDEIWQSPHLFPFNTCVQTHALNGTDPMHLTIVWEQKCGPHARLGGVFVYIVSQQTECHMLHAQVQCRQTLWSCPCLNVGQQVACTGTMRSDTLVMVLNVSRLHATCCMHRYNEVRHWSWSLMSVSRLHAQVQWGQTLVQWGQTLVMVLNVSQQVACTGTMRSDTLVMGLNVSQQVACHMLHAQAQWGQTLVMVLNVSQQVACHMLHAQVQWGQTLVMVLVLALVSRLHATCCMHRYNEVRHWSWSLS